MLVLKRKCGQGIEFEDGRGNKHYLVYLYRDKQKAVYRIDGEEVTKDWEEPFFIGEIRVFPIKQINEHCLQLGFKASRDWQIRRKEICLS